jgi:CRP-like cAMP-binding protein
MECSMTSLDQEVALLRSVPFFSSIEAGKLKLLAYSSEKLGFEDGEDVFLQGSTDGDAYFILEGSVDVLTERNGHEVRVAHLPQYALFGEISAFCDIPRTATVRARGHLLALRIPKENFLNLIAESPGVALQVIRVLALRVATTTSDLVAALEARGGS